MSLIKKYMLLNDLICLYKKHFNNEAGKLNNQQLFLAERIEILSKDINKHIITTRFFYSGLTSINIT